MTRAIPAYTPAIETDPDAEAAAWYEQLPSPLQVLVDGLVRELIKHPRLAGKRLGEGGALQLVFRIYEHHYAPGIALPERIVNA